ncbi:acyl carrier protein [Anaerobacterium chartisolvens]|uniref:Acyl carrier protein n=1 Tax=Anaerobacterium chartisolvens TaxID=1297424 RepID=A0A369ALQ4_9FIRM|nr:acyl carrier protein [Anaerobacterium chartisolvens]RCX09097.1 acyl carrier protein [Anaerobacterium chartisolvens]
MENYEDKYGIEKKLIKILSENVKFGDQAGNLSSKDNLEVLGINSVSFIKIAVEIENEFGFEFEDEDLNMEKFPNIGTIVEYVNTRQLSKDDI